MAYLIRIIAIALSVGAFFYWLFADTFRRYGKTAKDQPLVVAHWGDHIDYQMWSEIFEAFSQKYPEIKFERRHLPASRYHQKIQQQIVSDTAPDLFMMQDEPFPNLIASGKLEDLSPVYQGDGPVGGGRGDCKRGVLEDGRPRLRGVSSRD